MRNSTEVVIVGAGVVGCSIAFHLCTLGRRNVALLEKELAAGQGSTAHANGGIRAQWSTTINIKSSNYSIAAFERFGDTALKKFSCRDKDRGRIRKQIHPRCNVYC